LRTEAQKGSY